MATLKSTFNNNYLIKHILKILNSIKFYKRCKLQMVNNMIKNTNTKSKSARIDICDDYRLLVDNLSNPYCYNFGSIEKNNNPMNMKKLQNRVNIDYFYKR